jgi:hypothetical protein
MPHVIGPDNLPPRSSCCNVMLLVAREVHDTIQFAPEGYDPETRTLNVRYLKVHEGDADSFHVECSACGAEVDCEVEES